MHTTATPSRALDASHTGERPNPIIEAAIDCAHHRSEHDLPFVGDVAASIRADIDRRRSLASLGAVAEAMATLEHLGAGT